MKYMYTRQLDSLARGEDEYHTAEIYLQSDSYRYNWFEIPQDIQLLKLFFNVGNLSLHPQYGYVTRIWQEICSYLVMHRWIISKTIAKYMEWCL